MRYVILRDDDTNALTPIECLERLYRPFLDRGMPVNLAMIPDVSMDARTPEGKREGFLWEGNVEGGTDREVPVLAKNARIPGCERVRAPPVSGHLPHFDEARERHSSSGVTVPIGQNRELVRYLRENSDYRIVQHGCHHDCFEFDRKSPAEISGRLERGIRLLSEAGFPRPATFVAPHDKLSRESYRQVAKRFRVVSSGWFELRRLPLTWWPRYLGKKASHSAHWRVGRTILLSHPGCMLSAQRNFDSMLDEVTRCIQRQQLTVLVTHWWEYFRDGKAQEDFIGVLHQTADYLGSQEDIKVISFADLLRMRVPVN